MTTTKKQQVTPSLNGLEEKGSGEPLATLGEPKTARDLTVQTWAYTLRDEDGRWLAQVVLAADGYFSAVSDYGNFSFAWRAFGYKDGRDFRDFLSGLGVDYFGEKMYMGMAYVVHTKAVERAAYRFTEKVLPALKAALKADLESEERAKASLPSPEGEALPEPEAKGSPSLRARVVPGETHSVLWLEWDCGASSNISVPNHVAEAVKAALSKAQGEAKP